MHYVYVLKSAKDKQLYIGCTSNLRKRMSMHNKGGVTSTKNREPFTLMFYEAFQNSSDAFTREHWLKTGWGRNQLKVMLRNALKI